MVDMVEGKYGKGWWVWKRNITVYRGRERWNGTGSWTSSLIGLKSQSSVADPVQMPCGGVAMATDIARPRHCHEADIGPRGTLPIFDQTHPIRF